MINPHCAGPSPSEADSGRYPLPCLCAFSAPTVLSPQEGKWHEPPSLPRCDHSPQVLRQRQPSHRGPCQLCAKDRGPSVQTRQSPRWWRWCRENLQRWGHSDGVWEVLQDRSLGHQVAFESEWPLVLVIFQEAQECMGTI